MAEIRGERAGYRLQGIVGLPSLTRAQRSHQIFLMNKRPVVNRSLQYGFEDAFRGLLTIGRYPVGIILIETHPRFVDVNIHPTKREIRFRDERAARDAIRDIIREALSKLLPQDRVKIAPPPPLPAPYRVESAPASTLPQVPADAPEIPPPALPATVPEAPRLPEETPPEAPPVQPPDQTEFPGIAPKRPAQGIIPEAAYQPVGDLDEAPLQVFDTYLLVPTDERLLIIDQHALHERLNYDALIRELEDATYESQQLAVPMVIEVAPAQVKLVESNLDLFSKLGIEMESFGGNTFQITAICPIYEEGRICDTIYQILDELGQGDLFDRENMQADMLRLASRACKSSVRAGERLSPQERRGLLEGFRRLRPPYTCPHGRPIIVELTQRQMEKSFRRIQ
jgi:DNA mismatch repair protein MutL